MRIQHVARPSSCMLNPGHDVATNECAHPPLHCCPMKSAVTQRSYYLSFKARNAQAGRGTSTICEPLKHGRGGAQRSSCGCSSVVGACIDACVQDRGACWLWWYHRGWHPRRCWRHANRGCTYCRGTCASACVLCVSLRRVAMSCGDDKCVRVCVHPHNRLRCVPMPTVCCLSCARLPPGSL